MSLPDLRRLVRFDEQLREVPVDREAVESAFEAATRTLAADADDVKLLSYAGNAARILGRPDESIALFERALEVAEGDRAIVARIGLGEAYRCADRPAEAVAALEAALSEARRSGAHLDFALQHLGKSVLDAGDRARAAVVLAEALELRRREGDAALIESTELALARARGVRTARAARTSGWAADARSSRTRRTVVDRSDSSTQGRSSSLRSEVAGSIVSARGEHHAIAWARRSSNG